MDVAVGLLAVVLAVAVVVPLSRRAGVAAPLALVVLGVAASQVPGVPRVDLDPDLVLVGLLPPLLYAAAIRTSLVDFRSNTRAIGLLSVAYVLFTTVLVGVVAWLVVPGLPLAAGLALGAVVAPPDAVAATAIARRVGMPRRIVTVLEGESLVNDATALVALRAALGAVAGGVALVDVGVDFVTAAVGAVAVGVAVALVLDRVRARVRDPALDTTLSFAAPYLAFLPAEALHLSGVLAVVVAGLLLGHRSPVTLTAASRVSERVNWRTVQFVLEHAVFLLIGLQLPSVLEAAAGSGLTPLRLAGVALAVLAAVVLGRPLWVFPSIVLARLVRRRADRGGGPPSWAAAAVVSWAGMRGVVSLAAAASLPEDVPRRELLVLVAFVVVAGTLLLQGSTLPWVVRRLRLPAPDPQEDALQEAAVLQEAAEAGLARLDAEARPQDPEAVLQRLRARAHERAHAAWERVGAVSGRRETPSAVYRRLRLSMLDAERAAVLRLRDAGELDDEVLRAVQAMLDLEESALDRLEEREEVLTRGDDLVAPVPGGCEHLDAAPSIVAPRTPEGCEECLAEGRRDWVSLRLCLSCGHVGCCDSSPRRHADGHAGATEHPVIRSIEPGEAWRWCYPDRVLG